MLKRKYIKKMYIEECYCDKCGSPMIFSGFVLTTWPEQFPYKCTNPKCDGTEIFIGADRPGGLKYEFEEDVNV